MCGKGPALQQLFDEQVTLIGARVIEKGPDFGNRGNAADQVEEYAADELAVAGRSGGFNAQFPPRFVKAAVDPRCQLLRRQLVCRGRCTGGGTALVARSR